MELKYSAIRTFNLQAGQWTPIVTPNQCNYFVVLGTSDGSPAYRCSNPDDATTQYLMPSFGTFSNFGISIYNSFRYQSGSTVTYMMGTTTCQVYIEFMK